MWINVDTHASKQGLIQSSTKVNTNMQIRFTYFARVSRRSNLFMTTNTTDMSHRSRVEVGITLQMSINKFTLAI